MNDILNCTQFSPHDRPTSGYTYIYIYSYDEIYLYVGQTTQSIYARYKQHLHDNSGAHYANTIYGFQILSEYANYAEGYLAYHLKGICQGTVPNYQKWDVSDEVRKILQQLCNVFTKNLSCINTYNVLDFSIKSDRDYDVLQFLSQIVQEHNILWSHFNSNASFLGVSDIWLNDITYGNPMRLYLVSDAQCRNKPILFIFITNIKDIKKIQKDITDFPVYCIIEDNYYNKHKKQFDSIFKNTQFGIILKNQNNLFTHKTFQKQNNHINCSYMMFSTLCHKTKYRARKTPYGYFQCA